MPADQEGRLFLPTDSRLNQMRISFNFDFDGVAGTMASTSFSDNDIVNNTALWEGLFGGDEIHGDFVNFPEIRAFIHADIGDYAIPTRADLEALFPTTITITEGPLAGTHNIITVTNWTGDDEFSYYLAAGSGPMVPTVPGGPVTGNSPTARIYQELLLTVRFILNIPISTAPADPMFYTHVSAIAEYIEEALFAAVTEHRPFVANNIGNWPNFRPNTRIHVSIGRDYSN